MVNRYNLLIFLMFGILSIVGAQNIIINEGLASNSIFFDEDGDAPDWFELYNKGNEDINLGGWTVSDDLEEFDKWEIPETVIAPDSYLLIWASGKDRNQLSFTRNYIKQGDNVNYIVPEAPVDESWITTDFDDAAWRTGQLGIGYGDGDDTTPIASGTRSVFLRKTFSISDINNIEELILDIDYDDSFVAYLNGVEVARSFISGQPPAYNATANGNHEAEMYSGGSPERFYIANPRDVIKNGTNVLAIQAHNISSTSSDFSIIPFLSAVFTDQSLDGAIVPEVLQLNSKLYHTNFKLSGGNESVYLFDSNGDFQDSLFIQTDELNVSVGINPQTDSLSFFETATPGFQNITAASIGVLDSEIVFSHDGGPTNIFDLELSSDNEGAEIRYTINSAVPDENSLLYQGPIAINRNIVIRARLFKEDFIPSKTYSRTFLTRADHELPIISLITERDNLFGNSNGIHIMGANAESNFPHFGANFWEDWERPVHFSFYDEDGKLGELTDAGIKIFGGWSRGFEQKSFSLFARNKYGSGKFKHSFFKDIDYNSFETLVLRNSGNDWGRTMMRDATLTSLLEGADVEYQAYQPTVVYVNGSYWGIYNLREKINEHFVASKKDVDPDDVTILELDGEIIKGDNDEYTELIDFVSIQNMSNASSYDYVRDRVDIDNFALYYASQIYFDNQDWPGNNIKYWKTTDGKWRWVLFDTDFGFGIWDRNNHTNNTLAFALDSNGPSWPNPPWSTLLFRQLNENKDFTHVFINQMADAMNSRFKPQNVTEVIEKNRRRIASEVEDHYRRWNLNFQFWESNVTSMKNWGNRRPAFMKEFIKSEYKIPAFHKLTLQNNNALAGYVVINNRLVVEQGSWEGDYFETVPIELRAIAKIGSVFSHWEGDIDSEDEVITVDVNKATKVKAVFSLEDLVINPIIINEINYKSNPDFDTDDWIELYNTADVPINISNWLLMDGDENEYEIPLGTELGVDEYLILAKDLELFKSLVPTVRSIGDIGFGLSSKGDQISLFDQSGLIQDVVEYDNNEPWPEAANGNGFTLELINPELDNSQAENWTTVNEAGSPGMANTETTSVIDLNTNGSISIYPIPTSEILFIDIELSTKSDVDIKLVSIDGKIMRVVLQDTLQDGIHKLELELTSIHKGIYKIQATVNGQLFSESIMKH